LQAEVVEEKKEKEEKEKKADMMKVAATE